MYERFVNNVVGFVINPDKTKKNGREGVITQTILARIKRTERIFSLTKNHNAILYTTSWSALSMWFCTSRRKRVDITRSHALHQIGLNGPMYGARQGVGGSHGIGPRWAVLDTVKGRC